MPTPATVEIWESNGTSGAETHTKVTTYNFGSTDAPNLVAANYPLVIPQSGTTYAYSKWPRWNVITWVDTNLINTLRWYKSAGTNAANWGEPYHNNAGQVYSTPARSFSVFNLGTWPTLAGTAISVTGSRAIGAGAGYVNTTTYSPHSVNVNNNVVPGAKGSHTVSWVYDES